ncbi:zinc metalloprotease [Tenacibaculum caenipelagi]|uniref:Pregnancy-associated plasma protein-A n=1 Tax=Tenacibaculum caenipelagi TaxID=1325435 RepID=A0A4R6TJT4_9FLAO|nr:zinc metalloprotease [Tenacibaculum caenipelagi]TDQ28501.1 pregnancy-associated plasma protein-A [Tenacibaculum caenipelagi]
MKKLFLGLIVIMGAFIGCQENSKNEALPAQEAIDMSDFYVQTEELSHKGSSEQCYSMRVLNRQLQENPGLYKKMYDVEYATRKFLNSKKPDGTPGGGNGGNNGGGDTDVDVQPIEDGLNISIPVYFHVVLPDASQVSNSDIQSQMNVINSDFTSPNTNQLPSGATNFINDATNTEITFTLAGTFRHNDSRSEWGTRDAVKQAYPPITPETHLNIWVCNIGGGILGYAQFPGGNSATDGVVILHSSLPGGSAAPYNLGRTLTHEIGHYLNLRHIWGDGRCRQDDFVEDTPSSDSANYGCPSYPDVSCKSADMTMNYMDYTDDACMYMFTDGQRNRMRAIFAPGGVRSSMIN